MQAGNTVVVIVRMRARRTHRINEPIYAAIKGESRSSSGAIPGVHPKSSANSGSTHNSDTSSSITPLNGTTLRDNSGTPDIAMPA